MRRAIWVAAIAALAMASGAARAEFTPNPKQRNAIENIAQVAAGSKKCDDYELNLLLVAAIQRYDGFSLNDPETFAYADARTEFHANRIKNRTREDICAAMERLYGAEGSAVRGLAAKAK